MDFQATEAGAFFSSSSHSSQQVHEGSVHLLFGAPSVARPASREAACALARLRLLIASWLPPAGASLTPDTIGLRLGALAQGASGAILWSARSVEWAAALDRAIASSCHTVIAA